MQNYFNYYTEIEDHFQRRRGTLLLLSTLDWSLIATWQEAGFPLAAVLAGIDATFDKYESLAAKGRARRINGLAYCAQQVLRAVEDMHEAATGTNRKLGPSPEESGFEPSRIASFLRNTAEQLAAATIPAGAETKFSDTAKRLAELAGSLEPPGGANEKYPSIESLEQHLIVLEDQLFLTLQTFLPPEDLLALREQSARELAPYRSRLQTAQIRQIEQQFLRRCLFQQNDIPRLSLFYMGHR
ncbi:MAG: hypothetical protein ACYDC6_00520 [Acidobacteriaceae bacterium]